MPVTSLHVFIGSSSSSISMLKHFGLLRAGLQKMPGLIFGRAMGCGRGAAFSLWPDWQRYVLLTECATATDEEVLIHTPLFQNMALASRNVQRFALAPIRKHGTWDGYNPFTLIDDIDEKGRIAVLTRAAISTEQIPAFIHLSYKTTAALKVASSLHFSIGMGEYPLVRQATFTIWENDAAMEVYAYKDPLHIEAMKAKAAKKIFKEEMFVRFRIL